MALYYRFKKYKIGYYISKDKIVIKLKIK